MADIAFQRRSWLEPAWVAFALLNVAAMMLWPRWEAIPFHLIWFTLTLLYGFRVWRPGITVAVLTMMGAITGGLILVDAANGSQHWGELFEVPLMSAMFLAMVWHARRRQDALDALARESEERAALLSQQERLVHDISHELRTPVTIARGHLEIIGRSGGDDARGGIAIALDELDRIERIVERLLLLARAESAPLAVADVELAPLLEEIVLRWSDIARRVWRLGDLAEGVLRADPDGLRIAIDALIENAVNHTEPDDMIELRSTARGGAAVAIEVADEGCGIPEPALAEIFRRFARADEARSRTHGGVGLGLAIVDAIARAHGGDCSVSSSSAGSTFTLVLPGFTPAQTPATARAPDFAARRGSQDP